MKFSSHYLTCEGREIHYTQWGAEHTETVIAWHGLARTCRDMDDIAAQLASRYRVICPDTPGRGLSQWSPDPAREYCLAFYVRQAAALVDQLGLQSFHWLGTSMGGAIGTLAAATTLRGRIKRLVLNDNGPQLAQAAIARIRSYAGSPPSFATVIGEVAVADGAHHGAAAAGCVGQFGQVWAQADDAAGGRGQTDAVPAVVADTDLALGDAGQHGGQQRNEQARHAGATVLGVNPHCAATPHCQHNGLRAWQT